MPSPCSFFRIAPDARASLEELIGYVFVRPEILDLALTHSSRANESGCGGVHNERLEFLGDAVLELCVSWELFRRFPDAREGDLTRLRARLVSSASLAGLARGLGLDRLLRLGRGEEMQGGRQRDSVLSDAFEAVLAAVYADGGFDAAQRVVARIFSSHWPREARILPRKDCKTLLQEMAQARFKALPVYGRTDCRGPKHARIFEVVLFLPDGREFSATGPSWKKAEQNAARKALSFLGISDLPLSSG